MTNPNNPTTTVRVQQGSDVHVEGSGPIRVLVVNNDGNGDFGYKDLPSGSKVSDVLPGCVNKILVNGKPATADQVLQNGDKVSETPPNIEGA